MSIDTKERDNAADTFSRSMQALNSMALADLPPELDQDARDIARIILDHGKDYVGTEYCDMTAPLLESLARLVQAAKAADRLAELEEQLHLANIDALQTEAERAALEAENQRLRAEVRDVLANLDAPDDMDVISAAHFVAGSLSTAEEALEAAQAEARGLRAELARVRELAAKWRAAPQNPDEPLLAMAADELEAALSQPAEQHDPLAVSDHCPECSEPEPECVCGEQPAERESLPLTFTQGVLCSLSILDRYGDSIAYREVADPHDLNQLWEEADEFDREHLARHGYRPTPAAQESGDASD